MKRRSVPAGLTSAVVGGASVAALAPRGIRSPTSSTHRRSPRDQRVKRQIREAVCRDRGRYHQPKSGPQHITFQITANVKDDRRVVLPLPSEVPTGQTKLAVMPDPLAPENQQPAVGLTDWGSASGAQRESAIPLSAAWKRGSLRTGDRACGGGRLGGPG
jgi:hypothetical protein